jgi:hypothetical protein
LQKLPEDWESQKCEEDLLSQGKLLPPQKLLENREETGGTQKAQTKVKCQARVGIMSALITGQETPGGDACCPA